MDGIFIGATASKAMRNTMILATLGIFLPLLHWGPGDELNRLWIAFLAFMFCRGLFLSLSLKRSVFNLIK
jgi:MATE family multidrug resistance protein